MDNLFLLLSWKNLSTLLFYSMIFCVSVIDDRVLQLIRSFMDTCQPTGIVTGETNPLVSESLQEEVVVLKRRGSPSRS